MWIGKQLVKPESPKHQPNINLITAVTAAASLITLVVLSLAGIFEQLPLWAAVLIVVGELLAPVLIHWALRRKFGGG